MVEKFEKKFFGTWWVNTLEKDTQEYGSAPKFFGSRTLSVETSLKDTYGTSCFYEPQVLVIF